MVSLSATLLYAIRRFVDLLVDLVVFFIVNVVFQSTRADAEGSLREHPAIQGHHPKVAGTC